MEPTTIGTSSYILSKAAAALAGLFGGLSVSMFWQPKKLHQHGKLFAGAIIGGISVGAAFTMGGMIASFLGLNFKEVDTALGLGYMIGVICVGLIASVANFLENREDKDVLELFDEVKGRVKGTQESKPKPTPRPRVKRVSKTPPEASKPIPKQTPKANTPKPETKPSRPPRRKT
jgi:hypothetical protein